MENFSDSKNLLSLFFHKEGFCFCLYDENGNPGKTSHFKTSHTNLWEAEVIKELDLNLRLRRNYAGVSAGFVSHFYNLVPHAYISSVSNETLLNFSEAEFDDNAILVDKTKHGNSFVYGISQPLLDKLKELYPKINLFHSGKIFLDSISFSNQPELHLNLHERTLEAVVTSDKKVIFYNLFEVQTDEDILFYTLFILEQLELDANKVELKCYGKLLPSTSIYQTLKKYIRYISPALKNEEFLEEYSLFNLIKCASSPEISEEKK